MVSSTTTFEQSNKEFSSYPTQLLYKTGSYHKLTKCRARFLEEVNRGLCTTKDENTYIVFRDLDPANQPQHQKYNVASDAELEAWLHYQIELDPLTQLPNVPMVSVLRKPDPMCRFIYFSSSDSLEPLQATHRSLARTLTYHQVMPSYLDFLYVFGKQEKHSDLGYSGFHEQTMLSLPVRGPAVPELGRSGRQFQMSYNLKSPLYLKDVDVWIIRQVAIHHQFDVENGRSLWLMTFGDSKDIKDRVELMTGPHGQEEDRTFTSPDTCFKSSLAVHTLLAEWCGEDWRWRLKEMEHKIDEETFEFVDHSRARGRARRFCTPDDVTKLQAKSEKINEITIAIEANVGVLTRLRNYYESLMNHGDFPLKQTCESQILSFTAQIDETINDLVTYISRSKALAQRTADRKAVALLHLESQTAESMEAMTRSMYNLGLLSQTDAAAMRVITVLTLLYLPATFVSTFFSTDVVKYQNQGSSSSSSSGAGGSSAPASTGDQPVDSTSFSLVALLRWLEVTVPLTFVTIVIAIYLYRKSVKRMKLVSGTNGALPLWNPPIWI